MSMLAENQNIIYKKGEEEIGRISFSDLEKMPLNLAQYFRYYQPFTEKGEQLTIPQGNKSLRTSRVKSVERKGNSLIVNTMNSTYKIEFNGIDLEKVLADGKFKGINESKGVEIIQFPLSA